MLSNILYTPVDNLVEIIEKEPGCSLNNLKNKLKMPIEIIERWLIILEEFKVLKVQYKGFEGYVTLNKKSKKEDNTDRINIENLKQIFIEKSKVKDFSYTKMRQIWPIFISEYEKDIKQLFEEKAKDRGYEQIKIERAWIKFEEELKTF